MQSKYIKDSLEEVLLAERPGDVHKEFLCLHEKFMYSFETNDRQITPRVEQGYCDQKMIPIPLLVWMDLLARNSIAEAGRPDLQIIDELFMIFLYLYLHEAYRLDWLHRPGVRPLRLMKLIRAASVVVEAIDLRYSGADGSYRRFTFTLPGGIGQAVQVLRQVYLMGCAIVNDECVDMEQVIAQHEAEDEHRIEFAVPFRSFLTKCPLDKHVFPFERRVFIGDLDKKLLLSTLWKIAPPIPKLALKYPAWDDEAAETFLSSSTVSEISSSYLHQGRRLYVDPRKKEHIDPSAHDEVYGRGQFALLVKRLRRLQLKNV
jgi:hypothetical protein